MEFSISEISSYYASRLPALKQTAAREWRGPCPVHQGKRDNFSVNRETGYAHCHSGCGRGWDIAGLEMELTGSTFVAAKSAVFAAVGRPEVPWEERDIEATYDYEDADGVLRYQVVRSHGKKFWQRRPDGAGGWTRGLGGCTPLPYRASKLLGVEQVAIAEGERDVATLERLGFVATCNSGGAGNFKPELCGWFLGVDVLIFPDNDAKGREHAVKVAALLTPVAARVRIVELPCLPEKGDITDFIRAGGKREDMDAAIGRAQTWTPEWDWTAAVPVEAEKYVRTFAEVIEECGGLDEFWSLGEQMGLATPFPKLSEYLGGGMRAGEVYVIGANQGAGKTSLALQFILHAIRANTGVLLFSMEMGWRDVFQRMASIEARVDLMEYRNWQRNGQDHVSYRDAREALAKHTAALVDCPLLVSTKTRVTTKFIAEETMRLKKRQPLGLVVIDHMQLMASTGTERSDYEKFTAISRSMKETGRDLDVPILLVSQTSRNNEHDKRTELSVSDLRGSGAIEEDAAGVMLLYPDPKDKQLCVESGTFAKGPVKSWLKLGKSRYGQQDVALPLVHFKTFTRFDPWAA